MQFKVPTAVLDLPSEGLIYPEGHPLHEGKIELKYPGAAQEDILTNDYYKEQNIVLDKLFQSMMITKFDYDDLITGDKDQIFIATKILMFGKNYEIMYFLPGETQSKKIIADLTTIKSRPLNKELYTGINEFVFTLPVSKYEITYKLLTHKDEKLIDAENDAMKKITPANDKQVSTNWYYQIVAINGIRDTAVIREFINSGAFITLDSNPLREEIRKVSPGLILKFDYKDPETGKEYKDLDLPITRNFFRPSLGV